MRLAQYALFLFLLIALPLAITCGNDDDDDDSSANDDDTMANDDDTGPECEPGEVVKGGACVAAQMPDLPLEWTTIEPGGETTCSRGTPFQYQVHGGTVNKLLVFFQGGGACWNADTCGLAGAIFSETAGGAPDALGIFDFENPENPFKDWYAVHIPYCTGDVHWGDNTITYPPLGEAPEVTINHKGFVNGSTVMDWIYENFDYPESIFVSGCSAGAYGSFMFAPYLMKHYPDSDVNQLGDSGAGIITETFFEDSFPAWQALDNLPSWIPGLDEIALEDLSMPVVYTIASNFYPQFTYSQYNTAHDWNQGFYFIAMGGTQEEWDRRLIEGLDEIQAETETFREYTAWGNMHCIMPLGYFYDYQVDGVRFRDWVNDMANGEDVPDVRCTDCESPEYYEGASAP